MTFELKPCPFCGKEAFLYADDGIKVMCGTCKASTNRYYDIETIGGDLNYNATQEAVNAWNKRV